MPQVFRWHRLCSDTAKPAPKRMQGQPVPASLEEAGRSESERQGGQSGFEFMGKPSTGSPRDSWPTRDVKRGRDVKGREGEVERLQRRIEGRGGQVDRC